MIARNRYYSFALHERSLNNVSTVQELTNPKKINPEEPGNIRSVRPQPSNLQIKSFSWNPHLSLLRVVLLSVLRLVW